MKLGETIKQIRKKQKITQLALAAKSNISDSHLSAIERGSRWPSSPVLSRLAVALGCKVSDIYRLTENKD